MSYYRVWLQGKRSIVVEGDELELVENSGRGFEPGDVIIRKSGHLVARFHGKAVEGYDEQETAYPAPPRLPSGVGRFLWPVWVAKLIKTVIWRLQNPSLQP